MYFSVIELMTSVKIIEVFKHEKTNCSKLVPVLSYDVSKLAKSELSVFNFKSKSETQNLPKPHFYTIWKNKWWKIETIFVFTQIYLRQIMENFSNIQMAGSWERNLALDINLSGTQKWSKTSNFRLYKKYIRSSHEIL